MLDRSHGDSVSLLGVLQDRYHPKRTGPEIWYPSVSLAEALPLCLVKFTCEQRPRALVYQRHP